MTRSSSIFAPKLRLPFAKGKLLNVDRSLHPAAAAQTPVMSAPLLTRKAVHRPVAAAQALVPVPEALATVTLSRIIHQKLPVKILGARKLTPVGNLPNGVGKKK